MFYICGDEIGRMNLFDMHKICLSLIRRGNRRRYVRQRMQIFIYVRIFQGYNFDSRRSGRDQLGSTL